MFKNLLNIAFRNIWKNKMFSFINIVGLSIGLSAAFVIGVMIYYDLTFDKFHEDGDRIYRITTEFTSPDGSFYNHAASIPLGDALKERAAGIETIGTFFTSEMDKVENRETAKIFKTIEDVVLPMLPILIFLNING